MTDNRVIALAFLLATTPPLAAAQPAGNGLPCGIGPYDWCPAPPGDPCGEHKDFNACRADPRCVGMPYRGESVVACIKGERGFSPNCPTVGCRSPGAAQP